MLPTRKLNYAHTFLLYILCISNRRIREREFYLCYDNDKSFQVGISLPIAIAVVVCINKLSFSLANAKTHNHCAVREGERERERKRIYWCYPTAFVIQTLDCKSRTRIKKYHVFSSCWYFLFLFVRRFLLFLEAPCFRWFEHPVKIWLCLPWICVVDCLSFVQNFLFFFYDVLRLWCNSVCLYRVFSVNLSVLNRKLSYLSIIYQINEFERFRDRFFGAKICSHCDSTMNKQFHVCLSFLCFGIFGCIFKRLSLPVTVIVDAMKRIRVKFNGNTVCELNGAFHWNMSVHLIACCWMRILREI